MTGSVPDRDEIASLYLDQLQFEPYPVQEDALLAWFEEQQGLLVCTPTGTGKTLIAEAALFEALHTDRVAYYTTPLIALTEQKYREVQAAAVRWGFSEDDVGLVTGNRRVNPDARILVVVAEILLNRLLHREGFDFTRVGAVVMDEFHSFSDPERGIVWELSLGLLPGHVRLLLLSATVGNAADFVMWLKRCHDRTIRLLQSNDRRIPLHYEWVPDQFLEEQLELMAQGVEAQRRTPVLVFCFNRSECWSVAEQLKGRRMLDDEQKQRLQVALEQYDWSRGAGSKLRPLLQRGVGVHHAGLLPKYRRIIEELFQRKLLSVCICTETLAAGINLPARSVVLSTLLKGPPRKKKLIDASSAHQMFGRAGRPQFDDRGFVYAVAHDDDVRLLRWQNKYDAIPDDTGDPNLRRAKKTMKKKQPKRREGQQYWSAKQFEQLRQSRPGHLASNRRFPWRLLAYLLRISPEVVRLRSAVRRRLMEPRQLDQGEEELKRMLITLHAGEFVRLEPDPPLPQPEGTGAESAESDETPRTASTDAGTDDGQVGLLGRLIQEATGEQPKSDSPAPAKTNTPESLSLSIRDYQPKLAHPLPKLDQLFRFRGVNPIYGVFLLDHLPAADHDERIQILESLLEMPGSIIAQVRVPLPDQLPPGPLATTRLNPLLLSRGLVLPEEIEVPPDDDDPRARYRVLPVAEKLHLLFRSEFPEVHDVRIRPVWAVGELLRFGGDFDKYVKSRDLAKQEGIVFRHALRMILLCGEFSSVETDDVDVEWQWELENVAQQLTQACRSVDPESTDKAMAASQATVRLEAVEAQV